MPFMVGCALEIPDMPIIMTTAPSCDSDSLAYITNFDANNSYIFTPNDGVSIQSTGVNAGLILNLTPGVVYTVYATNGFCGSNFSTAFLINPMTPTPPTPILNIVGATCMVGGLPQIMNFNPNCTYIFTPAGPVITSTGWIQNYNNLQNYTVTATCGGCTSQPSAPFNNGPLAQPETPIINIGTPTCETSGVVITNFSNNLQYVFTPAGPWVANGVVFGLNVGVNYIVVALNDTCSSENASTPFSISTPLPETPPMPVISVTSPNCFDDGNAVVTNFSDQYTYTFVPQGPQIDSSGLITGVVCGVVYTIVATYGNCSSNVVSFIVGCAFQIPIAPIVCVSNGQAFITNFEPNLSYLFNPIGPQPNNNGEILGLTPNVDYTVEASNGVTCNSLPSNVFNISVPNNCNAATLIAFYDSNNNGIKDPDELPFDYGLFNFTINGGAIQNGYGSNGTYLIFDTNPDNVYALSYSIYANYQAFYQCTTSYNNVNINGSNTYYFPVTALNPDYQDLSVVILTYQPPRAGENHFVMVRYRNNSPNVVPNGTITFTKDNAVSMVSTSPSSTINGTGFVYDFTNLMPFEQRDIYVTMYTPPLPTVQINQPITHIVNIAPTTNDANLANNTFSLTQHVVAAYDPNDKMEAHGERIVFADYNPDEEFTYTIRFENEGNIYAINVRVTDELDAKIDETTVRMVAASHDYQLIREGNMLTWRFDNINLPVSVPGTMIGHGFITFSVKMKPGIQLGDTVPNKASIYFDTNPPIITNEFVTLFYDPLSTNNFQNQVAIYPNPSNDWVNIQSKAMIVSYTLVDLHGKTLMEKQHIQDTQTRLSLQDLSSGIYLIKIKTDQGDSLHKLVRQ
jgi:fimbrial isopeptide formation D2 family protein